MKNDVTVLVAGAAGHLGSHAVPLLLARGFRARGLDMADPAEPLPDACEFRKASLSDDEVLKEMLDGVDVILHAAALHPWKEYTNDQYLDANIKGTWHLYTVVEVMAGVREPGGPMGAFEAFYVTNRLRYTKEDVREVGVDPASPARKHWPEAVAWLEEQGYSSSWLPAVYDLSKAERLLGWRPEFNFEQAYAALREARG